MIVQNSVSHDARVLKEARSLSRSGYDVHVIGIADNRNRILEEALEPNLQVSRVDWQSKAYFLIGMYFAAGATALMVLCLTIFFDTFGLGSLMFFPLWNAFSTDLISVSRPIWSDWAQNQFAAPLIGLIGIVGGILGIKLARRYWGISARYSGASSTISTLQADNTLSKLSALRAGKYARSLRQLTNTAAAIYARRIRTHYLISKACAQNPAIVHCHDLEALPIGHKVKARTKCKLIWDAHEVYEEVAQGTERQKRKKQRLLKKLEQGVDGFITINDSIAQFYSERYPKLPQAVIVKNATLPIERFNYDGRLHNAASLPQDQKILLYQGGYAEKRGLRELVGAAQHLSPDWTLVMMGWGTIESSLRAIANNVISSSAPRAVPAVCFIEPAPQQELPFWSAGGTIGIIPYENIGLNHLFCTPNKLWEYPNAGVPILCSDLVEMRKTIEGHRIGWILPNEATAQDIALVVNSLTDEEIERAREACKGYISTDNWYVYEKKLLALYSSFKAELTISQISATEQ
ncbi:hypothetical protein ACSHT0_09930 [Tepidicaulis sp. LMO-SS28]|uniref:hypothetical protein n=1 Tax=Tepidicaulis sp. LMO-SS28 TaxID=3447455 RepID=UPI003EE39A59